MASRPLRGVLRARSARRPVRWVALAMTAALATAVLAPSTAGAAGPSLGHQSQQRLSRTGTAHLGRSGSGTLPMDRTRPEPESIADAPNLHVPSSMSAARVPSAQVPRPATLPVVDAAGAGFTGLSQFDQAWAGTGAYAGTQFTMEPPDQALCAGGGFVVEAVNLALRVHSASGAALTPAVPMSQFFGLAPAIVWPAGPIGPFTSDPKCLFDAATGRFVLSLLEIDADPVTGAFGRRSSVLIAVSATSDPTGDWYRFALDTTDDGTGGTPAHAGCPCLGDQPLLGADANGVYITTNEFTLDTFAFNGAQVYALDKAALAAGATANAVHLAGLSQAEGPAYSIQPTTTPPGGADATANGGTEYFLSALDFSATLDNRITLWALTNTASLATATPNVSLHQAVLTSEVYGQPPAMQQRPGPAPLDEALQGKEGVRLGLVTKPSTERLNLLSSNDDRMNQTVYAAGRVWGAVNTVVKGPTGPARTGIAWFGVTPAWTGDSLGGSVTSQGYIAVANENVAFPAIALNASGRGVVSFTLVGPDVYPSAAYAVLGADQAPGTVRVARTGSGPADSFSGELAFDPGSGGVQRWGDYGAAVADADGSIWFAAEAITQTCTLAQFLADTTCGGTRTALSNWGTYVGHVTP